MRVPTDSAPPASRARIQPGIWLDSRLALWFEADRLLVAADLHWGYAESHRARGNLLPAWGDDEIDRRLESLVADYQPAEMLWLGDVVHAAEGAARAEAHLRRATVPITVISGNHDRKWRGKGEAAVQRGDFFFHHGDVRRPIPPGCIEVIGHHHPAVSWNDGAGGCVKLPALVANSSQLILPAFSPWAAGTSCHLLMTPHAKVWAITSRRIFSLPAAKPVSAAV